MADKSAAQKFRESLKGVPLHIGTEGAARYTGTPIEYWSGSNVDPGDSQGKFYSDGKIRIYTNPENPPDYDTLSNTIRHENIHSALRKFTPESLKDIMYSDLGGEGRNIFSGPQNDTADLMKGWNESGRIGEMSQELPAYLGAYDQNKIKIGPELRQRYINRMLRRLPEENSNMVRRIIGE